MDALADKERKKYEKLWGSIPGYREDSAAEHLTGKLFKCFQSEIKEGDAVIDFGCGTGRAAPQLFNANLEVHLVDFCENCLDPLIHLHTTGPSPIFQFTRACLWDLPLDLKPARWGICFDVLEHIPEEKVDDVLKGMSLRIKKGGVLSIALYEDAFGEAIQEKLHLTVKPAQWWREKVSKHFTIGEELHNDEFYYVLSIYRK